MWDGEGARSREHDPRFAEWDESLRAGAVKAEAAEGHRRALSGAAAGGRDPPMDTGGAGALHDPAQPPEEQQAQYAGGPARPGARLRGASASGQMWGGGPEEGLRPGREATLLELREQEKAAVDWEMRLKRSDANAKRARRLQKKAFSLLDGQDDLHIKETKKIVRRQVKAERTLAKKLKKAQEKAQGRDESRERRRGDQQPSRRRRRGDTDEEAEAEEEEAALRRLRGGAAGDGGDDSPLRRPGVELAPAPAEAPEHAPRVGLFRRGGSGVLLEGMLALAVLALALRHWWRRGGLAPRASALHAKRGIPVATVGDSAYAAPATPEAAGRKPHAAAQPKRTSERTPEPPPLSRISPRRAGSALFPPPSPNLVVSSSDDSGMRSAACTSGTYLSGCSTTSALPTPPRFPHRRGHAQRRRPVAGQRSSGESASSSTNGEAETPQEGNLIVPGNFFIGEESDKERATAPPRGREPTQGSYLIGAASDVSSSDLDDETLVSVPSAPEASVPSEPTDVSSTTRRMTRAVKRMRGLRLAAAGAGRQAGDAAPLAAPGDLVSERVETSERGSAVQYQETVLERPASPRTCVRRVGADAAAAACAAEEEEATEHWQPPTRSVAAAEGSASPWTPSVCAEPPQAAEPPKAGAARRGDAAGLQQSLCVEAARLAREKAAKPRRQGASSAGASHGRTGAVASPSAAEAPARLSELMSPRPLMTARVPPPPPPAGACGASHARAPAAAQAPAAAAGAAQAARAGAAQAPGAPQAPAAAGAAPAALEGAAQAPAAPQAPLRRPKPPGPPPPPRQTARGGAAAAFKGEGDAREAAAQTAPAAPTAPAMPPAGEAPRAPSPSPGGCPSMPPAPAAAGLKRPKPPGPAPPKRAAAVPVAAPLRKSLITAKLKPLKSVEGTIFDAAGYSPDEQLLEAVLGSKSSAATPREVVARRGSKALLVLDGRRAQNIAIALRGARVRAEKVVSALQTMDCHMLEEGVAEALAPVFPTPDEAARLAGYTGERMKLLREIEQEAAALSSVPRGGARAWLLGAVLNMDATTQRSQAALRSTRLACVEIHASRRLRAVIAKILGAAQSAVSAFDAPGFSLSGMVQLLDAKGTSGRSILHYVCLECRASDPHFLESMLAELRRVPRAAAAQIHTVQEQMQDLERISRAALAELAGGHEEYASGDGVAARAALVGIVARSGASARSMRRAIERTGRVLAECERFLGHDRSKAACKDVQSPCAQLDTSAIAIVQSLLERFSRAWAEVRLREKELGPHSESGASCSEPGSARRQHTGSSSSCAASAGACAASRRRDWRQPGGQAAAAATASQEDAKDGAGSPPRPGTPAEGGTTWERQPSASTAAPSSSDFVEASAYQVAFDDPLASPRLDEDDLSPRRLASGSSDPLAFDDPSTEADPADAISRQATATTGARCHCPQTSSPAPASRGGAAPRGAAEGAE